MILAVFLISIFTFLLLGIPVGFSILLTVFTMATASGVTSFAIVPSYLYSGVNNFALMAIPFFILCGDIMNAGDLSKGIVDFCRVLLGHIKAGIGYAAILACMIFACLTGAAVVTISAIGGIMLQSAVNLLGTVYVASYDTALKIKSLCVGTCDALGNTMAVYCGQNLGAGKKDRIHAGIRDAMRIGAVGSVFFIFFLWNFTDQISLLFMDASNTEVIANIRLFMRITSCFYPLLYLLNIFRFSVQGMGESRIAMFAGVIEMVARTVSGLFLIPAAGYIMVCYTDQLAWLWATLFLVVVYRSILKKAL